MLLTLFTLLTLIHLFIRGSDGSQVNVECLPCCADQNMTETNTTSEFDACHTTPPPCASGQLTKNICECCDVCAIAEGDRCGFFDPCAEDLYCDKPPSKPMPAPFIIEGICRSNKAEGTKNMTQSKYYIVEVSDEDGQN